MNDLGYLPGSLEQKMDAIEHRLHRALVGTNFMAMAGKKEDEVVKLMPHSFVVEDCGKHEAAKLMLAICESGQVHRHWSVRIHEFRSVPWGDGVSIRTMAAVNTHFYFENAGEMAYARLLS